MRVANSIRSAAVAGSFYPARESPLRDLVTALLNAVAAGGRADAKAIIAPHAGYIYSGAVAAAAYQSLSRPPSEVRVILIGPAHFVAFHGLALPEGEGFATPLGIVPIDLIACRQLGRLRQVRPMEGAHRPEHALEVHLPFLQNLFAEFVIVPLLVGEATDEEVAEVVEQSWGGSETLFVISSDLSHYHNYLEARKLDERTAHAIESLAPSAIGAEQACGATAIRGFLKAAVRHGLHAQTLELRNSGDSGGPMDRVVGYGAFAFSQ